MRAQRGFTLPIVMGFVVVTSIVVSVTFRSTSTIKRQEMESEFLFRGTQYRNAIASYYEAAQPHQYPRSLEDLTRDPRFPLKRHLRNLYPDPLTRSGKWLPILDLQGGIVGVVSTSRETPIKAANFPKEFEDFAKAGSYSDWKFVYTPVMTPAFNSARKQLLPSVLTNSGSVGSQK